MLCCFPPSKVGKELSAFLSSLLFLISTPTGGQVDRCPEVSPLVPLPILPNISEAW